MEKEKYTLANGQESYKITSCEGKVLVRISDGKRRGKEVALGYEFRDAKGNVLSNPYMEKPEDYVEEDMTEEEIKMYQGMA